MRVWDLHPGYLNRQSLLGEHRELHGIVSILINRKTGYAQHPETKRWRGHGWALFMRHRLLAAEMALRGYREKSPVRMRSRKACWPSCYIDSPAQQIDILKEKYRNRETGRIPLPGNAQQLWSQHKYSVLARDPKLYRAIGKTIALPLRDQSDFSTLAVKLTETLRMRPSTGGIRNALQHMWGHVSDHSILKPGDISNWSSTRLLAEIQRRTVASSEPYLMASTALSELGAWLYPRPSTRYPDPHSDLRRPGAP